MLGSPVWAVAYSSAIGQADGLESAKRRDMCYLLRSEGEQGDGALT